VGLQDREGTRRLIAKLYAGGEGEPVYDLMAGLWRAGFSESAYTVPRPVAFDPLRQVMLLEWAGGQSIAQLLRAGAEPLSLMNRAGAWLAKLHSLPFDVGRRYTLAAHLHTLASRGRKLAEADLPAGRLYREVLRAFAERAGAAAGWRPGPTHRDFSPEHLFVDGETVTGLDLDEFCQYDPMFDVGHFIAHLQYLSLRSFGRLDVFDAAGERFVASYEDHGVECCGSRVALYRAAALLKLASISALVLQVENGREMARMLLQAALTGMSSAGV